MARKRWVAWGWLWKHAAAGRLTERSGVLASADCPNHCRHHNLPQGLPEEGANLCFLCHLNPFLLHFDQPFCPKYLEANTGGWGVTRGAERGVRLPTFFRIAEEGGTANREQTKLKQAKQEQMVRVILVNAIKCILCFCCFCLLSLLFNPFHLLRSYKHIDLFRAFDNPFACYANLSPHAPRVQLYPASYEAWMHMQSVPYLWPSAMPKDGMTCSKSLIVYQWSVVRPKKAAIISAFTSKLSGPTSC